MSSDLPNLNAHEARVLGVLVEKSLTTPEPPPMPSPGPPDPLGTP